MSIVRFSKSTVQEYWFKHKSLSKLFSSMHEIESWVLEDDELVYGRIDRWVNRLSEDSIQNLPYKAESLIIVFFFLHAKNAMYLYKKLTELEPSLDRSLQHTANEMLKNDNTKISALVFWDRFHHLMLYTSIETFLGEQQLKYLQASIEHVNSTRGTIDA